jgi:hypothetical protein
VPRITNGVVFFKKKEERKEREEKNKMGPINLPTAEGAYKVARKRTSGVLSGIPRISTKPLTGKEWSGKKSVPVSISVWLPWSGVPGAG